MNELTLLLVEKNVFALNKYRSNRLIVNKQNNPHSKQDIRILRFKKQHETSPGLDSLVNATGIPYLLE